MPVPGDVVLACVAGVLNHLPREPLHAGVEQGAQAMLRGASAHQFGGKGRAVAISRHEHQQLGDAIELGAQQFETEHQVGGYPPVLDPILGLIQCPATPR